MIHFFNDIARTRLTRWVFGWLFLVLLYQWSADLMISQLESPVLLRVDLDLTYWLVHLTGIGEFFRASYFAAFSFDFS